MSEFFPDARKIVADYLRLRDAGEATTADEIIRQHEKLLKDLKTEFGKIRSIDELLASQSGNHRAADSSDHEDKTVSPTTIIRCPHCHHPNRLSIKASLNSLNIFECDKCNDEFQLLRERKWPDRIEHFELVERIGGGGFGTVWKARDLELGRDVALKLPRRRYEEASDAEQFLREARTAAQLDHPNIVKIYEIGEYENDVFIVSELINGTSLAERIDSRLPQSEVLEYAVPLARALDYAHQKGVLHRDVKPHNVLLDASGKLYLSDFGLAHHLTSDMTATLDSTGTIFGTPSYMSPEQARGEQVDARSDVYSLGVVLYEMLTGQVPFQGTLQNVLRRLETEDPINPRRINAYISRDLDTICMKCLEKHPAKRYGTAREVADELERVRERRPILARPIGVPEKVARWVGRYPVESTLSVVILFAVLWAAGLFLNLQSQKKIAAVEARHTVIAQLRGELKEGKIGFRDRIFEQIQSRSDLLDDPLYRDQAREIAVMAMGNFVGYRPLRFDPQEHYKDSQATLDVPISASDISPQGEFVAFGFQDGRIELRKRNKRWDLMATCRPTFETTGDYIMSLRYLPESPGNLLGISHQGELWQISLDDTELEASRSYRFRYFSDPWDVRKNNGQRINGICYSPSARLLALCDDESVEVFSVVGPAIESIRHIGVGDLHGAKPRAVAVGDSAEYVVMGYSDDVGTTGGLKAWSLDGQNQEFTVPNFPGRQYECGLAFDATGKNVAACGLQTTLFEIGAGLQVRQRYQGTISKSTAFAPNHPFLAVSYYSGTVDIIDENSLNKILSLSDPLIGNGLDRVGFSANGKHLLMASQDGALAISFDACEERTTMKGHETGVPSVRFSPDGTTVTSTGKDGFVKVWNSLNGNLINQRDAGAAIQCAEFGPQGRWLATAAWNAEPGVSIWTFPELEDVYEVPNPPSNVCSIQFSRTGKYFAAIGYNGLVVWEVSSHDEGPQFTRIFDEPANATTSSLNRGNQPSGQSTQRTVGKDGKFLMFSEDEQSLYYVDDSYYVRRLSIPEKTSFEFRDGKRELGMGYNALAFTPQGDVVFVDYENKNRIAIWDVSDTSSNEQVTHPFETTLTDCAISTSSNGLLAALPSSGSFGIWDLHAKELLCRLPPERNSIWSFDWSPDGSRLVVGLADGGVSIWEVGAVQKQLRKLGVE